MSELFQLLAQNTNLKKENPLSPKNIIGAQKELTRAGYPIIPEKFLLLLRQFNGIKGEDGAVLGIAPENKSLDILIFNKIHNAGTQKLILGYDESAYLVFDSAEKKYFLIDCTDGAELDDFLETEFSSAISSVLHF